MFNVFIETCKQLDILVLGLLLPTDENLEIKIVNSMV